MATVWNIYFSFLTRQVEKLMDIDFLLLNTMDGAVTWSWLDDWITLHSRCISLMQKGQVYRLWRGKSKRKRAAHKQGLQRALASINQLRKEREEFAYPPSSVRARERGEWRWGELDLRPGVLTWIGRGVRGVFPKKIRRSCFLNGFNRTRMKEEKKVKVESWRESRCGRSSEN